MTVVDTPQFFASFDFFPFLSPGCPVYASNEEGPNRDYGNFAARTGMGHIENIPDVLCQDVEAGLIDRHGVNLDILSQDSSRTKRNMSPV